MKKLRVAIVSHNGLSFLKDCIESVRKAGITDIMVSDNASKDGTKDWLLETPRGVKLIISYGNKGFGVAANQMIEEAIRQNINYLFLLNQDTEINADMISELIACFIENPRLALVSPLHKTANGNLEYEFKKNCDRLNISLTEDQGLIEVPFVNAACWLMNLKAVKEIGGFNPIFFMYGEDLNYCQRAIHQGYKIGISTKASVIHNKPEGDYQSNLTKWGRVTSSFCLTKCLHPEHPENITSVLFSLIKSILVATIRGKFREGFVYGYSFFRLIYLWPVIAGNRKVMMNQGAFLDLKES
jgi:GT2 family glycosyltransferase